MSTTSTKKEIIDYIWDWAEQKGTWSKLLAKKVIENERPLTSTEREEVYNEFLISIELKKSKTQLKVDRPEYTPSQSSVKLNSLESIEGVNKLAKDQTLNFSKNITVIYGDNGTGKTGYGRLLKGFGFSYEKNSPILPNVYKNGSDNQAATIKYSVNGTEEEFAWDGKNHTDDHDLHSISIFNNSCVSLSIDSKRELLVTPIGFHLFDLLSNELNELDAMLRRTYSQYSINNHLIDILHPGTRAYKFISELSHNSSEKLLREIAPFSDENSKKLSEHREKKKELNSKLLEDQVKNLTHQLNELKQVSGSLEELKKTITKESWSNLQIEIEELKKLQKKEVLGLSEIVEGKGIELFESKEFQNFINSAEDYIKALDNENYPETETDRCIYCNQELHDPDALKLIQNYRKLLNDTTQKNKREKNKLIAEIIELMISTIGSVGLLKFPSFGEVEDTAEIIQPPELVKLIQELQPYSEMLTASKISEILKKEFSLSIEEAIDEINTKKKAIDTLITHKRESLTTIGDQEEKLTKEINELLDSEKLKQNLDKVLSDIRKLKIQNTLQRNASSFNTSALSRKTSEARDGLVAENFSLIFNEELKNIKRSSIKVGLSFRTESGKSKLIQKIESHYDLSQILSEGEQKAIALAEFLAELKLDNSTSPVIFDDPVTSLDHHIIDEVARRLVKLSNVRQVIVFTHSILLFNSIKQKSELSANRSLDYKYYETQKDTDFTGYLHESSSLKVDTYKNYEKAINGVLNTSKEERTSTESELAIKGYGMLRAAIEVFIETEVLNNSVRRYRKNVALTSFEKVNGELIDKHKERLNTIFERCCGFIDGHSSPDGLNHDPDLEELETDFKEIKKIRQEFL